MKKILFTAVVLSFCQVTCKTDSPCIGTPITDCICTQQYQPVCGCDNKTYGNACTARCAGIKSWKEGECK